jgi:hypothetical protein
LVVIIDQRLFLAVSAVRIGDLTQRMVGPFGSASGSPPRIPAEQLGFSLQNTRRAPAR